VTAFTVWHICLAAFFVILAIAHGAMWAANRVERLDAWLSLSALGFAMLSMSAGGGSRAADDAIGSSRGWLLLGSVSGVLLFIAMPLTAWTLFGVPVTRGRLAVVAVAMLGNIVWSALAVSQVTFETGAYHVEDLLSLRGPAVALLYVTILGMILLWFYEGLRASRTRPLLAALGLGAALLAAAILGHELYLTYGEGDGPTLAGLIGAPFLLVASSSSTISYIRNARERSR
jgi:hypothetical protein